MELVVVKDNKGRKSVFSSEYFPGVESKYEGDTVKIQLGDDNVSSIESILGVKDNQEFCILSKNQDQAIRDFDEYMKQEDNYRHTSVFDRIRDAVTSIEAYVNHLYKGNKPKVEYAHVK